MSSDNTTSARRKMIDELARKYPNRKPHGRTPKRLLVNDIETHPELFQPRKGVIDVDHVEHLVRALKAKGHKGDLDPILVVMGEGSHLMVDGHHRLEAYRVQGRKTIPIKPFQGTIEQAVLAAGKANSKVKKPMQPEERQSYAWRLVKLGVFTLPQIAEAAGISPRQAGYMRKVLAELRDEVEGLDSWRQVLMTAQGKVAKTQEEWEAARKALVDEFKKRLSETFGAKLRGNPDVAAKVLEAYFDKELLVLLWEFKHQRNDEMETFLDTVMARIKRNEFRPGIDPF